MTPCWPGSCHIGDCWANKNFCFSSACLNYVKIHSDNGNKSYKTSEAFREAPNMYFRGLTFVRKIKSMESSKTTKFTHNVH